MGQLRRAIMLIAATIIFASPCTAKVVKFEILKVESPAFEGPTFGSVGTCDRILVRATIAVALDDPRLSMAGRYPNQGERTVAITKATQQLISDRLILKEYPGLFTAHSN